MRITHDNMADQLRNGNPEALSALIEAFSGSVLALCTRILGGVGTPEDIEECVSDVFAAAWNKSEYYDETRGSLRTWLLILAKYQALEIRRKFKRRKNVVVTVGDGALSSIQDGANPVSVFAKQDDPVATEVLSREQQRAVFEAVKSMDPRLRDVFVRRYFLYESIEDIASDLDISRSAVDNRLSRSRRWLRDQLQENAKGGTAFDETR